MPRFKQTVPIDDYVLEVLMRDLIADMHPAQTSTDDAARETKDNAIWIVDAHRDRKAVRYACG